MVFALDRCSGYIIDSLSGGREGTVNIGLIRCALHTAHSLRKEPQRDNKKLACELSRKRREDKHPSTGVSRI